MKKVFLFLTCIIIVVSLSGCETKVNISDTTKATTEAIASDNLPANTQPSTDIENLSDNSTVIDITITETIENTLPVTKPAPVPTASEPTSTEPEKTTAATTTTTAPQSTETLNKTGEMAFSDDPNNRYIKSIASKYKVPVNTLVALYTVPENDSNIVLEFDGTKNADGTLKRNKDTLIAIYSINKKLESKRASENRSLNEYSYGEMKVMFISTTTYIMPEFEELK